MIRVLGALLEWTEEVGLAPYAYEWDRDAARKIGRLEAEWMREYPRWPSTRTATALFGSWRAVLTEAGLPSPPPLRLRLDERLRAAEALRDQPARPHRATKLTQSPWFLKVAVPSKRCHPPFLQSAFVSGSSWVSHAAPLPSPSASA